MEKELNTNKSDNQAMLKICGFIVDKRNLFFLLFGLLIIFFGHIQKLGRRGKFHVSLSARLYRDEAGTGFDGTGICYIRHLQRDGCESVL